VHRDKTLERISLFIYMGSGQVAHFNFVQYNKQKFIFKLIKDKRELRHILHGKKIYLQPVFINRLSNHQKKIFVIVKLQELLYCTNFLVLVRFIGFWRKFLAIHYDNKNQGFTRLSITNKTMYHLELTPNFYEIKIYVHLFFFYIFVLYHQWYVYHNLRTPTLVDTL
jgi:hypothetical protein